MRSSTAWKTGRRRPNTSSNSQKDNKYDSLGYKQIKLYNLVHPDLVPTIAEETHKRGIPVAALAGR